MADLLRRLETEKRLLDKTVMPTAIPEKMWIEKDRVVILGSYTVIGE